MARPSRMRLILDYVVYLIIRVLFCIVQALTLEACDSLSRILAWLASDLFKIRDKVTDENLRATYPEWTKRQRQTVKRQMWHHLLLMGCEIAHAPRKIHETNWRKYITIRDRKLMVNYLTSPRPVVFVSGHFGNFEMAGYASGLLGFPTYAIARPLDNPFLDRFIQRFRGSKGQYMLPKDGSAATVQQILDQGRTLSLLADQHAAKGCWVDFMGRPASCHKATAVFTLTADAPLLVCYVRRIDNKPLHFEIGVAGTLDPRTMPDSMRGIRPIIRWYNQRLEELIRSDPGQYWWLHRRWKEPPARHRKAARAA